MTQLNTELQTLSPALKALIDPHVGADRTCFVWGDVCVDRTYYLHPSKRINPEDKNVPLYSINSVVENVGMAGNYISVLTKTFGMPTVNVKHANETPNIQKNRYFLQRMPGSIPEYLQRIDLDTPQYPITFTVPEHEFNFLVVADYNKGKVTREIYNKLEDQCTGQIYVDTKRPDITMYRDATVKMNDEEFLRTRGQHKSIYRILHTMGDKGSRIVYPETNRIIECPASGAYAENVSGAGDVFFAVFIGAEQFLGLDEHDALVLATVAAGISIQYTYTYIPKLEEIFNVLRTKSFRVW